MSEQMRRMKARSMQKKKGGFEGNTLVFSKQTKPTPEARQLDDFSPLSDGELARMCKEPNPHRQPWMDGDTTSLPKKPPTRSA